jgi:glycosyltransferase involved in cell wall biosynthesis
LGAAASKVVTLRNWTHLSPSSEIEREVAKAELNWTSEPFLAVHTGNMGAKQALENIVDAARIAEQQNAPVHFVLVGDGGERRSLEERGRGVARLTFVDPLDEEEYRLALAAADVLLVNEKVGVSTMAMPSKLTAYFDAGRPVIAATDSNGITASEVRAAAAGVIVPAGDPVALLDAVLAMHADPEAAARYAASGRRHRESVLDERIALERWLDVVSSTVDEPG